MNVYILNHDDRWYDMGDTYVRGVYTDRAIAEASIVTRTASGRVSKAYDAHSTSCCSVEEVEVETGPDIDVKEDPVEGPQTGGLLIPESVIEHVVERVRGRLEHHAATRASDSARS